MPTVIEYFSDFEKYFENLSKSAAEEYSRRISEALDTEEIKKDLQLCIDLQTLSLSTDDPEKGALLSSAYSMLFKYHEAAANEIIFNVKADMIENDPDVQSDDRLLNNIRFDLIQKYKNGHLDISSVMTDQPPYYEDFLKFSPKNRHAVIRNLAENIIYGESETDISNIPYLNVLKAITESMIRTNALELINHSLDNDYDNKMQWLGFTTDQLDRTAQNFHKAGITKAAASAQYTVAKSDLSAERFDNIANMDTSYSALQSSTPQKEKSILFALQPIMDVNTDINANDYLEHFKKGTLTADESDWALASVQDLMQFAYNGKRDPEGFQAALDSGLPLFGFFIDGKNILEVPCTKDSAVTFGQMLDNIHLEGDSNSEYNDLMNHICETVVANALDGKKLDICLCTKENQISEYKLSNDPIRLNTHLDPAISADEKRGFSLWRWIKRLFGHGKTIAEKVKAANEKIDDRRKEQGSIDKLFDRSTSREKISLTDLVIATDPKLTKMTKTQKSDPTITKSK